MKSFTLYLNLIAIPFEIAIPFPAFLLRFGHSLQVLLFKGVKHTPYELRFSVSKRWLFRSKKKKPKAACRLNVGRWSSRCGTKTRVVILEQIISIASQLQWSNVSQLIVNHVTIINLPFVPECLTWVNRRWPWCNSNLHKKWTERYEFNFYSCRSVQFLNSGRDWLHFTSH